METILFFICEHAHYAPWIMFGLLLLGGLNLPVSEDIMLLGGGAIAATCIPDHTLKIYIVIFLGCYLSAWEAYWIGRLLGPRLYHIRPFKFIITPNRLERLRHYYARFGIFTFIIGRFCPGGIRNALFMSSGLTHMPFGHFILRDGIACLISSTVFFQIGYHFGANFDTLLFYFDRYSHWFLAVILILSLIGLAYWYTCHLANQREKD